MKAMVLAAGQGTRLRPLTDTQPKALVPVGGRPMIEYSLLLLRYYGIHDIVINLHHHGEQIEERLADGSGLGLQITYSVEPELLDTGGGLLKAKPFLQDDTFIVINSIKPRRHWFCGPTGMRIDTARWTSTCKIGSAGFSTQKCRCSRPARFES
jgi:CTP:phosphocholine cytidylyltransferase-like protein